MRRTYVFPVNNLIRNLALFSSSVSVGIMGGIFLILNTESIDLICNPRTPLYYVKEDMKQTEKYIKYKKERIIEKGKELECLNMFENSEKIEEKKKEIISLIEYTKKKIIEDETEIEVYRKGIEKIELEELKKIPLMPVEMGFRKLFYSP